MKTLVLTCPELDGGARRSMFKTSRFPNVEFVHGTSKRCLVDLHNLADSSVNDGYGETVWNYGDLAVAYGHLKLWQRVVELGCTCLVLEDDALPVPSRLFDYFKLDQLIAGPSFAQDWLLTLWRRGIRIYKDFDDDFVEVIASPGNSGLVGYVVRPEIAERLAAGFPGMRVPVDHYVLSGGHRGEARYTVLAPKVNLIEQRTGPSLRTA